MPRPVECILSPSQILAKAATLRVYADLEPHTIVSTPHLRRLFVCHHAALNAAYRHYEPCSPALERHIPCDVTSNARVVYLRHPADGELSSFH